MTSFALIFVLFWLIVVVAGKRKAGESLAPRFTRDRMIAAMVVVGLAAVTITLMHFFMRWLVPST